MRFFIKKHARAYLLSAFLALLSATSAYAEDTSQYVDFKTYNSNVTLAHTHIYVTEYDDNNHWERCTICDSIKNKTKHTLHSNGESMHTCSTYKNNAYKEICSCGYETKPFYVIHGRWENYTACKKLNYSNNPGNLDNVMQITKANFNSTFSGKKHEGQDYTWYDDDGDGYGWVFCGGPIMANSNGVKSTVSLIMGSAGDFGRHNEYDEIHTIAKILHTNESMSKSEFLAQLKPKNQLNTKHCLYGMKEKYSKMTDAQFNKLKAVFKGYYTHTSGWGWQTMCVQHPHHDDNGNNIYSDNNCYDSSKDARFSTSNGVETTCDVCGAHYTGNESYTDTHYINTTIATKLKNGDTVTTGEETVYGLNNKKLATFKQTFTKKNGITYLSKITVKCESGVSYENTVLEPVEIPISDQYVVNWIGHYYYPNQVVLKYGENKRTVKLGCYKPLKDVTAPVIISITPKGQNYKNGWATINTITVSGTEDVSSYVKLKLYDVTTGKQVGTTYTINVVNGKYSFSFTPQVEGPTSGRKYKIVAIDQYDNSSEKQFVVSKTDGTAPAVQSSLSYLEWSGVKTVTLQYTDYGAGADSSAQGVWVSFGEQNNYQKAQHLGNGKYQVSFKFGKEITGGKSYRVYAKDSLGNATVNTITVGNIDRTAPVVKSATVAVGSKSTVVTATDERSGIAAYGISTNTTAPKTWQTGNTLTQNDYGVYYVFVKDKAGNVSAYKKVTIGIFEIYYKLDNGTNNKSNPATYQVDTAVNFKSPTKKGYTFDGWYEDSAFKNKVTGIPAGSTGNKTVYAKWNLNIYKITYVLFGGKEASNPATYTVETPTITLKSPALTGFSFLGWTTPDSKEAKTVYQIPKGSIGDITISANWVSSKLSDDSLNNQGGNGSSDSGNSDNSDPDNARTKNTKTQHNKVSLG